MSLQTNSGVTTGATTVILIPTLDEPAILRSVNVLNQDTEDALVILRINNGGVYRSLKQQTLSKGVLATQLITHGLPLDAETVVINGKTYTYEATLTEADGNVKLTGVAATTATNLLNAINDSGGTKGTDYATANVADVHVDAVASGDNIDVNAKFMGAAANKIVIDVSDATNVTVGAAVLAGGVDPAEMQYNNPVALQDGDSLELVLVRAALTTELDWVVTYDK